MSRLHEALKTLSQLVKIKSVEGKPAPGAPFGKENREALDFILATAEKLGFRTFSYGGYYGYAETGDADKPMFGILGHLDVVPVSDGWRYPPFGGEIGEGYLWGRGTLDDKGPMVAALYSVRELLDEARLPKMRIRLIFGCNEESGWRCIEKYSEREEMPAMGFSPDANFPVIYCEKAVSHIDLYVPKPDVIIGFEAGSRVNIVPDSASAAVAEEFCRDILPTPEGVTRNGNVFYATGLSAHGSTPESGDNAALKLMKYLSGFMPEVKTLYELLRYSDGGGMGLKRSEPDYGALSGSEDNRIVVHENECYIGQPFSGYALSADSEEEIIIIGVLIEREAFFKIFLPAISADARLFHFFLKPQTDKYADEYIRLRFDDSCNVRTLLEMMVIEYASPGEDTQAILQPLALALLMQVARRCRASRAEPEGEAPAGKIIRFMGEHAGALKLRDVAARFSYHPNYVSGLLRRVTGKTFSEISLEQRMRRAEILLKCTKLSVEDIALMLGYSSSSNFYKAFREYFGKSPREYLKA